jgi:hypothetical protein
VDYLLIINHIHKVVTVGTVATQHPKAILASRMGSLFKASAQQNSLGYFVEPTMSALSNATLHTNFTRFGMTCFKLASFYF